VVLAPVLFVILFNVDLRGLEVPAHRLLAVLAAVVTPGSPRRFHCRHRAPGAGAVRADGRVRPEAGTPPVKQVFRSFADPVIFLFSAASCSPKRCCTTG